MELIITLLLGCFIVFGAFLAKCANNKDLWEQLSMSIAFGSISALIILELLPETMEHLEGTSIMMLPVCVFIGVLGLKYLDSLVPAHCHSHQPHHCCSSATTVHIGIMSALAICMHNLTEGMAVYGVLADNFRAGAVMALGIGLHNIPLGMLIYATLRHTEAKRRCFLIALTSLATFVGGLLMSFAMQFVTEMMIGILISCSLGMLVYIAIFELLHHLVYAENKLVSLGGTIIGIVILYICTRLE